MLYRKSTEFLKNLKSKNNKKNFMLINQSISNSFKNIVFLRELYKIFCARKAQNKARLKK